MTAAQASSSLMTLACITLILPAACETFVCLIQARAHAVHLDHASESGAGSSLFEPGTSISGTSHGLLILSRGTSIILLLTYIGYLVFQLKTHAQLFEAETSEEEEVPSMDLWSSAIWLLVITVITAFCADILVGSIDETAQTWNIPKRWVRKSQSCPDA